ncbi:MAG: TetR/AcrR family transcriptional regulator [Umezawaea sp.]
MGWQGSPHRSGSQRRSSAARPTDDELLDAAREVFAAQGFTHATMGAIAERADSTKPTLYAHFGDKAALYRALVARETVALQAWVLDVYESAAPLRVDLQVHGYVMAMFTYAATHPDSFRILFDSAVDEMSNERRSLVDTITNRVTEQISAFLTELGRPSGPSVELLAAMMVGLVGRAASTLSHAGDVDPIAAGELASGFINAAIANLDPALLDAVDRVG